MNAEPGTIEISYSVHSKTEDGQISLTWMAFINPLEDAIAYAKGRPNYRIVKTTREVLPIEQPENT